MPPEWSTMIEHFHWLRPWWLAGIPLLLALTWLLLKSQASDNQWRRLINPSLLPHLIQGKPSRQQKLPYWFLAVMFTLASIAMAGPSWEKLPQPVHKSENAMVILLDLSPSMDAQDLSPSRLVRARLKLIDLLAARHEGLTALIAYAGEAHVVTPLTDDTDTIASLLPSLSPEIMPLPGSNTEMALDLGIKLIREAGLPRGEFLLVTDGVTDTARDYLTRTIPSGYRLSVLGVGTREGAPIPLRGGGFAKEPDGDMMLARLDTDQLANLAQSSHGVYETLTPSDKDIDELLDQPPLINEQTRELQRQYDTWQDAGFWLCLLLLPLFVGAFRRGWLLMLFCTLWLPQPSQALEWQDLWATPDQQGQKLLQSEKPAAAAEKFERPDWRGTAQYQAENYEGAIDAYRQDNSPEGLYNLGNALAKTGKLKDAIKAYDDALQQNPKLDDARFNRDLVQSLLDQQQNSQQDSSGQENSDQQPSDGDNAKNQPQNGSGNNDQDDAQSQPGDTPPEGESGGDQNADGEPERQGDEQNRNPEDSTGENGEPQDQQNSDEDDNSSNAGSPEQAGEEESENAQNAAASAAEAPEMSDEERQAMEQWLRKIPDDPSGLMRKKFQYQYRQRRKEYSMGTWQPPENDANKRW